MLFINVTIRNVSSLILVVFLMLFPTLFTGLYGACQSCHEEHSLASELGWVKEKNEHNVCDGYYREFPISYVPNPFVASQKNSYNISSDQALYAFKGKSTLRGNVRISQEGSELLSDVAYLYRDKKTAKPLFAEVFGHVRLVDPGRLLLADRGKIDLQTKVITLEQGSYRKVLNDTKVKKTQNSERKQSEKRLYQMNAWGQARKAIQLKRGVVDLYEASYTTCPPLQKVWRLKANKVHLDSEKGRGDAYHARLLIRGIPFFYTPYINFPIDKKRYTGFLTPSFSSSSGSGMVLNLPFYLNLAPNYDATVIPKIITKRGLLLDNSFRYLTPGSYGEIGFGFILEDRGFKAFKETAKVKWSDRPTFSRLQNTKNDRWGLGWKNKTTFNSHWSTKIDFNRVSDDYYMNDFSNKLINNSDNNLLQTIQVNYASRYGSFLGNVQKYQTLHLVNRADVKNQYAKLPQLLLNLHYPSNQDGLNYFLQTEMVHFSKEKTDFERGQFTPHPVTGNRFSVRPGVSLPLFRTFGYVIPRVQLQMIKYHLHHSEMRNATDPGMILPLFDIKTGLFFNRNVSLFKNQYMQTLEPKWYYLYVPYRNQNRMPIFDTLPQVFHYDMLFQDNRFSGVDRIGDANRAALGITSRFVDRMSGNEKAKFGLGQVYYFNKRKVSLCSGNDCLSSPTDKHSLSPLVAFASYSFNPIWSLKAGLTWNEEFSKFDQQSMGIQYLPNANHIVNLKYNFSRGGDILAGAPSGSPKNDLKQMDLSTYWKLTNRWSVLGRWNYNLSHDHGQAYLAGVMLESCCWAMRMVVARTFEGVSSGLNQRNLYDTSFFIQFSLKELGNIGNRDPGSVLSETIPGYIDKFGQGD